MKYIVRVFANELTLIESLRISSEEDGIGPCFVGTGLISRNELATRVLRVETETWQISRLRPRENESLRRRREDVGRDC